MKRSLLLLCLLLAGCDNAGKTAQTLANDIVEYSADPRPETAVRIEANFARLDGQIEALRAKGQDIEAGAWRQERDALKLRFAAARVAGNLQNVKKAAEDLGKTFRQAGEAFGEAFKDKPPAE
jgi:hypothetical protein